MPRDYITYITKADVVAEQDDKQAKAALNDKKIKDPSPEEGKKAIEQNAKAKPITVQPKVEDVVDPKTAKPKEGGKDE